MQKKAAKSDPVLNALLIAVIIVGLLFSVQVSGLVPAQGQSVPMYGSYPIRSVAPVYTAPVRQKKVQPSSATRAAIRRTEREMRIHHAAPAQSSSSSSAARRSR